MNSSCEQQTQENVQTKGLNEIKLIPQNEEQFQPKICSDRTYKAHAQDTIKNKLEMLTEEMVFLEKKKQKSFATDDEIKRLKQVKNDIEINDKKLKQLILNQKRQQLKRNREKAQIAENPELAKQLNKREKIGRPRLEFDQPNLLPTIVKLASHGAGAHARRRREQLQTVRTLPDMHSALKDLGFEVIFCN